MLRIYCDKAPTNASTCKICGEKILKGTLRVYAIGYQTSGAVHVKCCRKPTTTYMGKLLL
jgi:hypothetical protein